jgi:hypothetical protein
VIVFELVFGAQEGSQIKYVSGGWGIMNPFNPKKGGIDLTKVWSDSYDEHEHESRVYLNLIIESPFSRELPDY